MYLHEDRESFKDIIEWDGIVAQQELNFIMGNPPFVGAGIMSSEQKTKILFMVGSVLADRVIINA